jgi:hypothetical protein
MLYIKIDEDDFIDRMNRAHESTTHGFSDDGLKALFKYLEEESKYNDEELDPIAISCHFVEYKTMDEALNENDVPYDGEVIRVDTGSVIIGCS